MLKTVIEIQAHLVAKDFVQFQKSMADFRMVAELRDLPDDDVETLLSAMGAVDKAARVGRYVKHQVRNDPKPDFPDGMVQEMVGAIVYFDLLAKKYGVDMQPGIVSELLKAANQHGDKE